ncbi:MAG: IS66 family transposase [bacterium]
MGLSEINIKESLDNARQLLALEKNLSPALKASMELLILIVSLLSNQVGLNSRNSSKPPSSDPNREKKTRSKGERKPGGQPGHEGKTLEPVDDPDDVKCITLDRRRLPRGEYHDGGYEARQVVDIDISLWVTEYRAQVLIDQSGERYVAEFPTKVNRPIQYGDSVKAHAVYLSQYQLLPYNRIADYFNDQVGIPLSEGSIYNFNVEARGLIESSGAAAIIKQRLQDSEVLHADETGINVGGQRHWLHVASSLNWTWFHPHRQRGGEAMVDVGILPAYAGILCHDHWKPYLALKCQHSLCNAHHLRELECAWEQDDQAWAKSMQTLLLDINQAVNDAGGKLTQEDGEAHRKNYKIILEAGDIECPPPDETLRKPGQRGRLKRSKSRNLLERLRKYEDDVLRFMENTAVPFTNNQGENDIRMTKVQQKISGCFRSMVGAEIFCTVRSYIGSCRKQGVSATEALSGLFAGSLPSIFVQTAE